MRELKFRALTQTTDKILGYVNMYDLLRGGPDVLPDLVEAVLEGVKFEQYTGLKDRNGKEIWVGDIISFSIPHFDKATFGYDGETELVGKIIFDYDRFCIEDKDGVLYDLYSVKSGEVIGNIHENGELLGCD